MPLLECAPILIVQRKDDKVENNQKDVNSDYTLLLVGELLQIVGQVRVHYDLAVVSPGQEAQLLIAVHYGYVVHLRPGLVLGRPVGYPLDNGPVQGHFKLLLIIRNVLFLFACLLVVAFDLENLLPLLVVVRRHCDLRSLPF